MSGEPHNAACRAYAKISGRMADGAAIDSALAAWCEAKIPVRYDDDPNGHVTAWLREQIAALRGDSAS